VNATIGRGATVDHRSSCCRRHASVACVKAHQRYAFRLRSMRARGSPLTGWSAVSSSHSLRRPPARLLAQHLPRSCGRSGTTMSSADTPKSSITVTRWAQRGASGSFRCSFDGGSWHLAGAARIQADPGARVQGAWSV